MSGAMPAAGAEKERLELPGVFALHALHTHRPPLVDLRLFKARSFSASTALMFLSGFGVYGALVTALGRRRLT